jgi:hypothetical protein
LNYGVFIIILWSTAEVANGFNCPAAGEVLASVGSFSRHAHPDDCRKYYICLEGTPREYGCPIGTVFKIGDADGSGNCENPEDVPGWYANMTYLLEFLFFKYFDTFTHYSPSTIYNRSDII